MGPRYRASPPRPQGSPRGVSRVPAVLRSGSVHALFRIDDPLPVPPGQSPFRMRGLYYDRMIAKLKADFGLDHVLREIEDPSVRAFAAQKFAWTGWYDALPAKPICAAAVRLSGVDFEKMLTERTRLGALDVIPSAFRMAFRIPGPAALASQVALVAAQMMDFVHVEVDESRLDFTSGWGRGVPLYVAPHTASTVVGFFLAMFEMRGGADVRGGYSDVVKDGSRHGFETVAIRYEFSWTSR